MRGRAAAIDARHFLCLRIVVEEETITAEAARRGQHDSADARRRERRVHRVAAPFERPEARRRRQWMRGGDHAAPPHRDAAPLAGAARVEWKIARTGRSAAIILSCHSALLR